MTCLVVSLLWSLSVAGQVPAGIQISGPFTHENLTIFLVHPPRGDNSGNRRYLTLQQAMEQKKVVVVETKQVNELAVEDVSDEEVYLQNGDIVRGGQQDRVLRKQT
jgi:hypothetical protein